MRGDILVPSFCLVVLCSLAWADPVNLIGARKKLHIQNLSDEQDWKNNHQNRSIARPPKGPEFRLYTRENRNNYKVIKNDTSSVDNSNFNPSDLTVVVVHGFTESGNSKWMKDIKDRRLDMDECNVILVDWKELAAAANLPPYFVASSNTQRVGEDIAYLINFLKNYYGLSTAKTHMVGFSLGAHVSGVAGYELQSLAGSYNTLGRITGLDPAGPLFEEGFLTSLCGASLRRRLDPSDADFVDVIRTNDELYGCTPRLGDVDFLMNGGSLQPGCRGGYSACSHGRAHDYYVESFTSKPKKGFLYENYDQEKTDSCIDKETFNYVGFNVSDKHHGAFYAKTADKPPFLGKNNRLITLVSEEQVSNDNGKVMMKVSIDFDWEEIWRSGVKGTLTPTSCPPRPDHPDINSGVDLPQKLGGTSSV